MTYHSVLSPVSLAFWYSGRDGTTVGRFVTLEVAIGMVPVAEAKAWIGSTIIVLPLLLCGFNFKYLSDEEVDVVGM